MNLTKVDKRVFVQRIQKKGKENSNFRILELENYPPSRYLPLLLRRRRWQNITLNVRRTQTFCNLRLSHNALTIISMIFSITPIKVDFCQRNRCNRCRFVATFVLISQAVYRWCRACRVADRTKMLREFPSFDLGGPVFDAPKQQHSCQLQSTR